MVRSLLLLVIVSYCRRIAGWVIIRAVLAPRQPGQAVRGPAALYRCREHFKARSEPTTPLRAGLKLQAVPSLYVANATNAAYSVPVRQAVSTADLVSCPGNETEPAFHLIEPRGIGECVVHVIPGRCPKSANLSCLGRESTLDNVMVEVPQSRTAASEPTLRLNHPMHR
jgi:hypothetical protein